MLPAGAVGPGADSSPPGVRTPRHPLLWTVAAWQEGSAPSSPPLCFGGLGPPAGAQPLMLPPPGLPPNLDGLLSARLFPTGYDARLSGDVQEKPNFVISSARVVLSMHLSKTE